MRNRGEPDVQRLGEAWENGFDGEEGLSGHGFGQYRKICLPSKVEGICG